MPRRNSTTRRLASAPAEFPDFGRFHAEIRVRGERLCLEAGIVSPPSLGERVARSIRALSVRREASTVPSERVQLGRTLTQLEEVQSVLDTVRLYSAFRRR